MSSHDARQEDSRAYDDEPGSTATRTDQQPVDRDDTTTDGGPVLLPVDPGPEPTADDRATAGDSAPVTIVDPEDPNVGVGDRTGTGTDQAAPRDDTVFGDRDLTDAREGSDARDLTDTREGFADRDPTDETGDVSTGAEEPSDSPEASVAPETETGALKDPAPDGGLPSEAVAVATPTSTSPTSASPSSTSAGSSEADWHELQGRFVDDPEAAVREAGALVEKAFNALRARSETGSTEDLRTAFRRYRDLYTHLN